jgi:hypothetical protein
MLIREVIRDQLNTLRPPETELVETVSLSTDEELAAFVARLLDLDTAERDDLRAGRKHFRLAAPAPPASGASPVPVPAPPAPAPPSVPLAPSAPHPPPLTRRVERGAVTERMIRDAARAGERLVLGRGAVLTPLAADRARASGVEIEKER